MQNKDQPPSGAPDVARAQFAELDQGAAAAGAGWLRKQLSLVHGVKVSLRACLGGSQLTIGELFALKEGSIVALDRGPDGPVDIALEGNVIARGEIVVVGEHFGIRITEILRGDEA